MDEALTQNRSTAAEGFRSAPPYGTARRAAHYLAWVNLAGGVLALTGPAVTGNRDRIVNLHTGKLLGIAAVNWRHAALHLAFGAYGLAARRSERDALRYLDVSVGFFGGLAAMTLYRLRGCRGPVDMMGMAIDRNGSYGHLALVGYALVSTLQSCREDYRHSTRQKH